MGTNYYWHSNPCTKCHRADEVLHIGKSSVGWAFSLHRVEGFTDFCDWLQVFTGVGHIENDCGSIIDVAMMLHIINSRPANIQFHKNGTKAFNWEWIDGEFS